MFPLISIDFTDPIPLIGQPSNQSSTHDGPRSGTADKAVDGDTDGNYYQDSCTHTKLGKGPLPNSGARPDWGDRAVAPGV